MDDNYKIIENVPSNTGTYSVRIYSETYVDIISKHGGQANWCKDQGLIENQVTNVLLNPTIIVDGNLPLTYHYWSETHQTSVVVKMIKPDSGRVKTAYPRSRPP